MIALMSLFLAIVVALFKSTARLEAQNALLRQHLIILRHKIPTRVRIHAPADSLPTPFYGMRRRLRSARRRNDALGSERVQLFRKISGST